MNPLTPLTRLTLRDAAKLTGKISILFIMKSKPLLKSTWVAIGAFFIFALLLGAGCGKSQLKLTASESKAFASAPAEVKLAWEQALAADKANDYANTHKLLESLRQMQLNADQMQAVEMESAAFGQRLWAAAKNNDPAAVKVVRDIKTFRAGNVPAR